MIFHFSTNISWVICRDLASSVIECRDHREDREDAVSHITCHPHAIVIRPCVKTLMGVAPVSSERLALFTLAKNLTVHICPIMGFLHLNRSESSYQRCEFFGVQGIRATLTEKIPYFASSWTSEEIGLILTAVFQ